MGGSIVLAGASFCQAELLREVGGWISQQLLRLPPGPLAQLLPRLRLLPAPHPPLPLLEQTRAQEPPHRLSLVHAPSARAPAQLPATFLGNTAVSWSRWAPPSAPEHPGESRISFRSDGKKNVFSQQNEVPGTPLGRSRAQDPSALYHPGPVIAARDIFISILESLLENAKAPKPRGKVTQRNKGLAGSCGASGMCMCW